MPKYTVIINGKEKTIDKDKFDKNVEAISAKYPDAKIKAINGDEEGILPVSNYSKAIERGYRMVELKTDIPVSRFVQGKGKDTTIFGVPYSIYAQMNPESQSHYYQKALDEEREQERNQLEERAASIKGKADEQHVSAMGDKVQADYDAVMNNPFLAVNDPMLGVEMKTSDQAKSQKKVELTRAASERADDTFNMIEEAGRKGNTSFVSGFGRGFWEKVSKASTWDFGGRDMQANLAISSAAKKYEAGEPLSDEEENLLDAVALEAAANGEFSGDLGRGYKAGGTTAESLPFMAEFMINPATGTGKAVSRVAAKKIVSNFGKEAAKSTIGKIARNSVRVIGDVAGAGIMTGTTGAMRTSADAVDRMTGNISPVIDADGYYRFGGAEGGEGAWESLVKAYGASTIENFSEMFGNYLAPIGGLLGAGTGKVLNRIGLGKVNKIIGDVKSSDMARMLDNFQSRTQWNGTIGEYLEEQAGMAMNALIVGDNNLSDMFDPDIQIDTFLGVSALGGLFSGIKTVGYASEKYSAKNKLNEADRRASRIMNSNQGWIDLKNQIDEADDSELVSILAGVMKDEGIEDEAKQAVLMYAGRLKTYHGTSLADLKRKTEGDTPDEVVRSQLNFDEGYRLAEADRNGKRKAFREMSETEKKLDNEFLSGDEKLQYDLIKQRAEAGEDVSHELAYINARSRFDGMIQGIRDAIDEKVSRSNEYITNVTHKDGNVYDITLSSDVNKHVFPVSGSIVFDENGLVDRKRSDSRFIVRDDKGNIEMRPVEDLYKLESSSNAELLKDMTSQTIREQESARHAEEIETPSDEEKAEEVDAIQPGDVISLDMQGMQVGATVQSKRDGSTVLQLDNPVEYDGKKVQAVELPDEQLRAMIIPAEENGSNMIDSAGENEGYIPIGESKLTDMPMGDTIKQEEESVENIESKTSAQDDSVPAVSIPVDEKGNLLYHKAPVELTIADLNDGNLTTDEVDAFVSANKEEAAKLLKKTSEKPPKIGTNKAKYLEEKKKWADAVADINSQVSYWNEIEAQMQAIREQPGDVTAGEIKAMGEPLNGEELAAMMLGNGKLPLLYNDYKRETGFSNADARGMFGMFSTKENGGMTVEQAGEQLMLADMEAGTNFFDQDDPNAGRNAILDVLSSARTRGGLIDYIKNNREAMAERERQAEVEADELAREQWFQDNFHMTYEEYQLWDQGELFSESNMISDEEYQEFMSMFVDEILNKQENDRRTSQESGRGIAESESNEQGRISGVRESGIPVLQGEESISSGTTGRIEEESTQVDADGSAEHDALQGSPSGRVDKQGNPINDRGDLIIDYIQSISDISDEDFTLPFRNIGLPIVPKNVSSALGSGEKPIIIKKNILEKNRNNHPEITPQASRSILQDALYSPTLIGQAQPIKRPNYWVAIETSDKNSVVVLEVNDNKDNVEIVGWRLVDSKGLEKLKRQAEREGGQFLIQTLNDNAAAALSALPSDLSSESKDSEESENKQANGEFIAPSHMEGESLFSYAERVTDAHLLHQEEKKVDTNPTEAQKEAGNYKKGHIRIDGFDITIENPKGIERSGVDADGKPWSVTMNNTYGYIRGTEGVDGDHIDVFLGNSGNGVYVVDQVKEDGSFDEHKVMYGFGSMAEAKEAYLSNYSSGWKGLGNITGVSKDVFKEWVDSSRRKTKPFAEYKSIKAIDEAENTFSNKEYGADHIARNNDEEELNRNGDGFYTDDAVAFENDPVAKMLGRSKYRSKAQRKSFADRERSRMEERVTELAKKLHLDNVEIVTDASQLDGKKAKSKGFYSKSTGKITVVIPNHATTEDAIQTLLHEAVAHHGLRHMFGEQFDTFLDNVLHNANEDVRSSIVQLARNNGLDFRKATEEYLAGLAESTNFEYAQNSGWWSKIKSLFLDMLHQIGFDGFRESLSDNELRYILWRSYENLAEPGRYRSIIGDAANIAKQHELEVGDYSEEHNAAMKVAEKDVLYRVDEGVYDVNERLEQEVSLFYDAYNGKQNVILTGNMTDEQLKEFGIDNEHVGIVREILNDGKTLAGFVPSLNKILIFADNITDSNLSKIESTLLHENIHGILNDMYGEESRYIAQVFYDSAKENYKKLDSFLKGNYDIDEVPEEFFVYMLENDMFEGNFERYSQFLKNEELETLNLILKNIGYDKQRTEGRGTDNSTDSGKREMWNGSSSGINEKKEVLRTERGGKEGEDKLRLSSDARSQREERGRGKDDSSREREQKEKQSIDEISSTAESIIDKAEKIVMNRKINDQALKLRDQEREDIARQIYEDSLDKAKNKMYRWREAYQDSMLALKNLQEAIVKESREDLKYFEDAYMAENQMSSRSSFETEVYKDKFFASMMDAIKKITDEGIDRKEVNIYVMAKHGLERNKVFAKRDAERAANDEFDEKISEVNKLLDEGSITHEEWEEKMDELKVQKEDLYEQEYIKNRNKDYSGLTQLTDEQEEYEEAAKGIVESFEDRFDTKELWKKINLATKQTLKKSYESGLMTKATYKKVNGMFEYYVPLRGFEDQVASDVYDYILSDKSPFNAPVQEAKGRRSQADDPFATIGNMAESGILQGNRNLMKQKFLNMVMNHPTSLVTVKTMWYERVVTGDKEEWVESFPEIKEGATPDEVSEAIEEHERRMLDLEKDRLSIRSNSKINLEYRASKREKSEHTVVVKSGGKEYVIYINGNPRAAQAINGLTNPDSSDNKLMKGIQWLNRQMAANFTTRNPAFVLSNMSRDVIFSTSAIWVKEDWKYAQRFDKNILKNIGAIASLMARYKSGRLNMRVSRDRYFLEFLENGGETGYTALHNVDEYKKMMDRHVKKSNGAWGSVSSGAHAIVDAVSFMNRCAENVSRFTTYQTSREMGRGISESIRDAKEVTVNFNKKGAGGLGATTFKSLFLFFNAAVQSLKNFKDLHDKSKSKFYTSIGGFASAGILLPMINNAIIEMLAGDEDDDMTDEERAEWARKRSAYDNLPEWVRKNNFCIWVGGERFVTIPLPIELRAFYGLGEMWYQMGRGNMNGVDGRIDAKEASVNMLNQLSELLPINPLGGNGDVLSVIVPDAGKPLYQVFRNKDFFGKPIYKKGDYNEDMPAWTKAYNGTADWMVNSAEFLNELSGGDKYMKGEVDLNPATLEHVFEGYFGGMGKTANQLYKTISMIWNEDERMWRNVPIANRFISGSDDKIEFRKVNEIYHQFIDEYNKTGLRLRGYENEAKMGLEEYAEKLDFLYDSKENERYQVMKEYKSLIDELLKEAKESDPEEKKDIEMEINLLKMEMIDEVQKIR